MLANADEIKINGMAIQCIEHTNDTPIPQLSRNEEFLIALIIRQC
ncbi:MAG: hypothetical protein ACJAR3_001156 [Roseivirga sp.]|jgi:hypothetical protein